jgi:hypothetical protein
MAKQKKEVYAVIRVDDFHDPAVPLENKITVKEIVPSLEVADAEVARLNALNNSKGSRYFWQATRLDTGDE